MFLGSSCCNIAENSTFARPLDFACRLNPSFHAFAEACATETLGTYSSEEKTMARTIRNKLDGVVSFRTFRHICNARREGVNNKSDRG